MFCTLRSLFLGELFVRSGAGGDREISVLLIKMSSVLERLRQEVERVKLLRSRNPKMFQAVKDPARLQSVMEKIDQDSLLECNACPVVQVLEHVQQLHGLLVAERAAILKEEESNQPEFKARYQDQILSEFNSFEETNTIRQHKMKEQKKKKKNLTVEMIEDEYGLRLHVSSAKWDGAVIAILEAIEAMGLTVLQADISCDELFIFDALLEEDFASAEMEANVKKPRKGSPSP